MMNAHAAAALLLMMLPAAAAGPAKASFRLIVVVSASQKTVDLSSGDLRRIYIGEMTRWPDGRRIVPVMLPASSRETEMFLRRVVRMSAIDFSQQWISVVFRGRVPAPPVVAPTVRDAVRFVDSHPEAIAFVSGEVSSVAGPSTSAGDAHPAGADRHSGVRVINIDGRSPRASEYPLNW